MTQVAFSGRLLVVGCGSIGQGVLPLILRHIAMPRERIHILTADERGQDVAAEYGVALTRLRLAPENFREALSPLLGAGDFLLNLSVEVSSVALIGLCRELGALYLDTCIEPWAGGYTDSSLPPARRTNYALRESALALREADAPTAVLAHGANPGLVSHLLKAALLRIAGDRGMGEAAPDRREGWGTLARDLGLKAVHIAERDTQTSRVPKRRDEFVNTWSIDGFTGEGCQPAELGWGTHERTFPPDGRRYDFGCNASIYLLRPGAITRVRSWTPLEGPYHGFMITHNESISIADYYTLRDDAGAPLYRPTVFYAYHPCDDAVLSLHEFAGKNWHLQNGKRLMMDEIADGTDELGVLAMGDFGAYWYGSRLAIEDARRLVPYNNATSLQVTAAVLGGMVWAIEHPRAGIVEADEIDHARVLAVAEPYLGEVVGAYSDWTPLQDRGRLFPEDLDESCPWQFRNFRVS